MAKEYIVGRYKLTAMQKACYDYIKNNKGSHTTDQIIKGVYGVTPDTWTYEEKYNNVIKWCSLLLHFKLIVLDDNKYKFKN